MRKKTKLLAIAFILLPVLFHQCDYPKKYYPDDEMEFFPYEVGDEFKMTTGKDTIKLIVNEINAEEHYDMKGLVNISIDIGINESLISIKSDDWKTCPIHSKLNYSDDDLNSITLYLDIKNYHQLFGYWFNGQKYNSTDHNTMVSGIDFKRNSVTFKQACFYQVTFKKDVGLQEIKIYDGETWTLIE